MSATTPPATRPVLADLLPDVAVRDAALVVGAALLTGACAQLTIPLPYVPITMQTFSVLLTSAALGTKRAVSAMGLYVLLGAAGLPFYSEGGAGVGHLLGSSGGYLVGFIAAGAVIGACAERGLDRSAGRALLAFALGSTVIFAFGVPWLAVAADLSAADALRFGLLPFLPGSVLKALLAAGLLPAAWKLAR